MYSIFQHSAAQAAHKHTLRVVGRPLKGSTGATGGAISNSKLHSSSITRTNADGLASEAFLGKLYCHSIHGDDHIRVFLPRALASFLSI